MRIRSKINIDYANIIKDDIRVKYKKSKIRKTIKKAKKTKNNLLYNSNFRNNQNYILKKNDIAKINNSYSIRLLLLYIITAFIIMFSTFLFYILLLLIPIFLYLFYLIHQNHKNTKNYIFKVKEQYFNKHFIYIADRK